MSDAAWNVRRVDGETARPVGMPLTTHPWPRAANAAPGGRLASSKARAALVQYNVHYKFNEKTKE